MTLNLAISVPLTVNVHGNLYLYLSITYVVLLESRGKTGVDWRKTHQSRFAQ